MAPRRLEAASARLSSIVASPALPWAIVTGGIILRLARYLADRSLWLDESYLALNLMNRSFGQLIHTLDYNQGAPLGFLFTEKATLRVFGDSEYALRLPSLLVGIASLFLFYAAAKPILSRGAFLISLLFFATLEPFIYYSEEIKQYGFDVAVALALLALAVRFGRARLDVRRAVGLAAAGFVAVWFSHPAVFVLLGLGAGLSIEPLLRREWSVLASHFAVYATWIASFAVTYVLSIRNFGALQESVLPSGTEATGRGRLLKELYVIFNYPGTLPRTAAGLGVVVAIAGVALLARRHWHVPVMLGVAAAGVYLAATRGTYPLNGRYILFLLPGAIILFGAGTAALAARPRRLASTLVAAGAVLLLVGPAFGKAVEHLVRPPAIEDVRPLLDYVSSRWQPGDALYLYPYAQYPLRYYLTCKDCDGLTQQERSRWPLRLVRPAADQYTPALASASPRVIVGSFTPRDPTIGFQQDLARLRQRGGRIWILFTHYFPLSSDAIFKPLDAAGRRAECKTRGFAFACLYDFPKTA